MTNVPVADVYVARRDVPDDPYILSGDVRLVVEVSLSTDRIDRTTKAEAYAAGELKHGPLALVDEDTRSFDRILQAMQLPKGSPEQVEARKLAIREATKGAILVPLRTLELCVESMSVMQAMAARTRQTARK